MLPVHGTEWLRVYIDYSKGNSFLPILFLRHFPNKIYENTERIILNADALYLKQTASQD